MTRIQDKPPVSAYPVTDRIVGVAASAVLLATMLCFASTGGRTREAHAPTHEADKPIATAAAYQRPAETGRIEELIEYRNPTPLSDELFRAVDAASVEYGVPVCLALGLIEVESGFDAEAVGPDGEDIGLCQIRTSNHAWLMSETGADPMTPEGNIQCGMWLLGDLLSRHDTMGALTAYRWGRDTGDREYANKVMETAWAWEQEFREGASTDGIYRRGTG
ncbi:MAG: transglycosylase SLT domain-containing protein [Intestinimonas massiliensis]|uniref:transglycosylase SLT domain-containing protein n=1 Tax=Intestinimonas massiliensis (ex Afouda et al. 2020) TaxID=1673721 RepID=UPI00242DAE8A|nr:transglycosylase SLT domain-containing protein [Intestinimonas massiliensis (ex Afouda et al. 2020)]MCI5563833.1 transglycosylase SLT domain-containing protein [Intestinimonas massiliensis (ex Afouda et al. 2020)]